MGRNSFNNAGYTVCARDFKFAGVEYETGEDFPWRELGKDGGPLLEDELRGLWLADYVNFVEPGEHRHGNPVKLQRRGRGRGRAAVEPADQDADQSTVDTVP